MSDKYRKCAKCGASAVQNPTLTFHSFPRAGKATSLARLRLWTDFCFPDDNFSDGQLEDLHKSHKLVCSKHFDRSSYTDASLKKLNRNAVPNERIMPVPGLSLSQQLLEVPASTSVIQQCMLPDITANEISLTEAVIAQTVPGPPQRQPEVPENTSVLQAKLKQRKAHKNNQIKKCKKYINKIYRLKKSLQLKKESKKNRKYLLEALSESVYLEKLNQNLNPAFSLMLQSQLTNTPRKLNGRRWTLDQKIIALAIYKKSNACYRLLRRLFCLPNPGTLKSLLNKVPLQCGVNNKVMANLKEVTQGQAVKDNLCILLFDEMSIRKNLVYNPKTDQIEGYQDHGSQGRSSQIASHALVFMLVGLRKRWKQPIAHYFSGVSVTADRLQALIKEVLAECYQNDLQVVATVCDMDGVNMRALNVLGSTVDSPYFTFEENEVVTVMDPPHLLKCFRNNFLKHNIKCPKNFALSGMSGVAKWEHIKEFYEKDKLNPNFVFAPALTDQHLNPNGKQKMRVKLAAQVLSHSVAAGMFAKVASNDISSDAVVTATLISKIDDVFDSLNADSPDLNRGKPYSTNLTQRSRHLQLFHEMKNLFLEVEFIGARCAPPSVNGWIKTIRAVERLWHNLRKHEINSLATRRINQDPLENLFGCIRSHCGSNPNPTIQQFIGGLKTSIINNLRYQSIQKNCEDDNNTLLTNMSTYINTKQKQIATTSQNQLHDFEINEEDQKEIGEMQACAYICGFIYRKLKHKDCESCKKIMLSNDFATVHTFTNFKEYNESKSSLNYVTDDFIQCVEACATNINNYLEINAYTTGLKKNLRKNLNNVTCSWLDGCKQHKTETFDHIANSVLCITIKRYCILKNRMFAEDASANAMKRKISILKHV